MQHIIATSNNIKGKNVMIFLQQFLENDLFTILNSKIFNPPLIIVLHHQEIQVSYDAFDLTQTPTYIFFSKDGHTFINTLNTKFLFLNYPKSPINSRIVLILLPKYMYNRSYACKACKNCIKNITSSGLMVQNRNKLNN